MDYEKEYKYLKQQLEDERAERERQSWEAYERRQEQRRQREREWQEEQCYAESWGEAFCKALPRLRHEASMEVDTLFADETPWFSEQVKEHEFAHDAWKEEMVTVQARIERIRQRMERRIAKLEQSARNRAADRTDEHFGKETFVGENLRNDDYNALVNW